MHSAQSIERVADPEPAFGSAVILDGITNWYKYGPKWEAGNPKEFWVAYPIKFDGKRWAAITQIDLMAEEGDLFIGGMSVLILHERSKMPWPDTRSNAQRVDVSIVDAWQSDSTVMSFSNAVAGALPHKPYRSDARLRADFLNTTTKLLPNYLKKAALGRQTFSRTRKLYPIDMFCPITKKGGVVRWNEVEGTFRASMFDETYSEVSEASWRKFAGLVESALKAK